MPRVYLVRHGEPDNTHADQAGWWGPMRDLAPLTDRGIGQALAVGRRLRATDACSIISSPMTRALQTASLIAAEIGLPPAAVDVDLREWLPDSSLSWRSLEDVQALAKDRDACGGEWPPGEQRRWEPLSVVRNRALAALRRHATFEPFIAVCHTTVIETLTGETTVEHCGIRMITVADHHG